uniref:Uncharacterized protein n=1 Tax=Oryza sativa subsp. japonica TaxID=39947 RepID=Q339E9_ORYSJ|nr:hypothetical protein LOC_Os10g21720 [Oryza sativa Japonica Group]
MAARRGRRQIVAGSERRRRRRRMGAGDERRPCGADPAQGACRFAWIGCLCERLCHRGRGLQGHQHASTSTAIAPAAAVLPPSGKDLKNLDADFVKQATLFDLIVVFRPFRNIQGNVIPKS